MRVMTAGTAAALIGTACISLAADWPQYPWPQPKLDLARKGILRSWPANGPEVLWTAAVGIGYGGPVVKDGEVYLLDRDDKVGDKLRCLALANGKELWSFAYDGPGTGDVPGLPKRTDGRGQSRLFVRP